MSWMKRFLKWGLDLGPFPTKTNTNLLLIYIEVEFLEIPIHKKPYKNIVFMQLGLSYINFINMSLYNSL